MRSRYTPQRKLNPITCKHPSSSAVNPICPIQSLAISEEIDTKYVLGLKGVMPVDFIPLRHLIQPDALKH